MKWGMKIYVGILLGLLTLLGLALLGACSYICCMNIIAAIL